jgi:hypothetical protein
MSKSTKWVAMVTAMLLATAPVFAGDDKGAKPAPPPEEKVESKGAPQVPPDTERSSDAAAELKAGTGVNKKKREVIGEAESFTAGTKVWVWSNITGAKGENVKHVWKRGDKVLWEMEFTAKSSRYRTWSRHKVKAGEYTVEVQTEDGSVLGTVSFTVT